MPMRVIHFVGLWALLVGAHNPMYLDRGKHSPIVLDVDTQTYFDAPLSKNGLTVANPSSSWSVPGVAAPSVVWWGDDPTGSSGYSTHTFTQSGSSSEYNTMFCPDGSHDDITSGCMNARAFPSDTVYYESDTDGIANPGSDDFSVCVALVTPSTDAGTVVSHREGPAGEGWSLLVDADSYAPRFIVENHAANQDTVNYNDTDIKAGNWAILCGTYDADGNLNAYLNGIADGTPTASSGGVVNVTGEPLVIGAREVDYAIDYEGAILFVMYWDSLLDATDTVELVEAFSGILDTKGAPVTFTNVGPLCCMIDSKLRCVQDQMPLMGCELPPGWSAGAGSPSSGTLLHASITNSVPYSLDLDSWTDVGTPVPTATSTDLFECTSRQTYRITDNDAGAVEGVQSAAVDITSLDTADKVQICVYAKDSSGTKLDLQVTEQTGGGCANTTTNFAAKTIDTTWTHYEWTHTLDDGACTELLVKLSPTDWGTVAETGSAEVVVQVHKDTTRCVPFYVHTEAAAVSAAAGILNYDVSGNSNLTTIADGTTFSVDFTPYNASSPSEAYWTLTDSATAMDYYYIQWTSGNDIQVTAASTEDAGPSLLFNLTGTWTPTVGTTYTHEVGIVSSGASFAIDGVPQAGTNATLTTDPNSLDKLCIGSLCAVLGIEVPAGYGWYQNFTVTK